MLEVVSMDSAAHLDYMVQIYSWYIKTHLENIGLFILDFTKKLSTYASDLAP
jgi:hypothetical protein